MRRVFADAGYWLALVNPRDGLHERALSVSRSSGRWFIVTSEPVLAEFLNHFAARGSQFRSTASALVEQVRQNPNCEVVPWTSHLFHAGFVLYTERQDKQWSLTDCTSFVIMQARNVSEALAHDQHFEQAGFKALLR